LTGVLRGKSVLAGPVQTSTIGRSIKSQVNAATTVAVFASLLVPAGPIPAQNFAERGVKVRGIVATSTGAPAGGAKVWAFPAPPKGGWLGDFSEIGADNHGRFQLIVSSGRYVIRAKSDEAGYPDPNWAAFSDPTARFPMVTVDASGVSGVVVRLGEKGAFLQGTVYDAESGAPIANAKLTLRDARGHGWLELSCQKDGHFQYVAPSKPILISAVAPGYKPANFAGGKAVTFASGDHRTSSLALVRQ
jgi:hypothetical protein